MYKKLFIGLSFGLFLSFFLNFSLASAKENMISKDAENLIEDIVTNIDSLNVKDKHGNDLTESFITTLIDLYEKQSFNKIYEYIIDEVAELTYTEDKTNNNTNFQSTASNIATKTYTKFTPRGYEEFFHSDPNWGSYKFSWAETLKVTYTYNTTYGSIQTFLYN